MISEKDAERIAIGILGRQPDDEIRPWGLREFEHGWLIVNLKPPAEPMRGGSTRAIERGTGQLISFPSSVSQQQILEEYPEVRRWGHEVRPST